MPGKGQSQTEEAKKKISEALKKDGGANVEVGKIKRSPAAQKMYNDYTASIKVNETLRAQRDALKASIKKIKRGSKQKTAINAKIKAIQDKIREEKQKRMAIRKEAMAAKRVKKAEIYIQKAQLRNKQVDDMEARARERAGKAKTPESKARYQAILDRISTVRIQIKDSIDKAKGIISNKGATDSISGAFDFDEKLQDLPYKPIRALTIQEQRCNLEYLNEQFNQLQTELEAELKEITDADIERFVESTKKKIDAGDVAAIAALILLIRGKVKKALDDKLIAAYEAGKKTAAGEMQVERPATPLAQTQLKNLDVNDVADGYVGDLVQVGKSNIKNALAVGAATAAIIATTRDKMKKEAEKQITNIAGTMIGQYVNRGRQQVFSQNIKRIAKFQRSEVLDGRTCNMCFSLDKKVVMADDPLAQMDIVHSHCRGVWIPIFVADEEQPDVTGIPKSILDSFELIDGRPIVNSFKQLKKPIK